MYFIKDQEFIRGNIPMTKEEIRTLSICKLNLNKNSKFLDVGCGTGSITVQAALIARSGSVTAIDKDDEAIEITKENIEKFNIKNVSLVQGEAKEILKTIDSYEYDAIFIGGSLGDLENIINESLRILKSKGNLVLNFITLTNAYKAKEIFLDKGINCSMNLIQISKCIGSKGMLKANNPIFILNAIKEEK